MDVCLVVVPFQNLENPCLSLSLLKACLTREGISSEVLYANMDFARRVGMESYYAVVWSGQYREILLGEYAFSAAAFRAQAPDAAAYAAFLQCGLRAVMGEAGVARLLGYVEETRAQAAAFTNELARRIASSGARVVACASTTQQNCAVLALLRRVKELAPSIVTIVGGPNCEGRMGAAMAAQFPWLDFVVSGEADDFFAAFCRDVLRYGTQVPADRLPRGVLRRGAPVSQAMSEHLDAMPPPDFDDYFAALHSFPLREQVRPALLIETSRGCWWGEKTPCTFCGLNGACRKFREKSPQRVCEELAQLCKRYGARDFFAVDCILSLRHLAQVMPRLQECGAPYNLMYEVKSNLSAAQLKLLREAGVRWLQPGIESLHDGFLRLMRKGNSAIRHVELLKNASEAGVRCYWILLCAFPQEQPVWYAELLALLRRIGHLQPPYAVFKLRYDRFSAYWEAPARYGLDLEPVEAYRHVYPAALSDALGDLAYFFADRGKPHPLHAEEFVEPHHVALARAAKRWREAFRGAAREHLAAKRLPDGLEIMDLRDIAPKSLYVLQGLAAEIALSCRRVIRRKNLRQCLAARGMQAGEAEIDAALQSLQALELLLEIGGELLFLPLFDAPPLPPPETQPLGAVTF